MQIIFFTILFSFFSLGKSISSDFMDKGFYVIDLKNKIEWLKCTNGKQWSDEKQDCLGEPVKLDFEEITLALDILNQEIEGPWRLPSRKELESLVCKKCEGA